MFEVILRKYTENLNKYRTENLNEIVTFSLRFSVPQMVVWFYTSYQTVTHIMIQDQTNGKTSSR